MVDGEVVATEEERFSRRKHGPFSAWELPEQTARQRLTHAGINPGDNAVLVADGRGECASHLAGAYRDHRSTVLADSVLFGLLGKCRATTVSGAVWALLTADFTRRRVLSGPRTPGKGLRMAVTSVAIPPVACAHRLRFRDVR